MMRVLKTVFTLIYTRLRLLRGRRRLCLLLVVCVACLIFMTLFNGHHQTSSKAISVGGDIDLNNIHHLTIPNELLMSLKRQNTTVLMVMIHSSGNSAGRLRRDAARTTWVSELSLEQIMHEFGTRVIYRFILGSRDVSAEAAINLNIESRLNGDLALLDDVPDSHESLTQRTLSSFLNVPTAEIRSLQPQYVLKCDDDTYVNLVAVVHRLVTRPTRGSLYWGEFVGGYPVLTKGAYAEQAWNLCDQYLPYAYGGGYLLSWDLVELISENARNLIQYRNEDVTLSVWLAPYNVERIHDQGFDTGSDSKGCVWPFIVAHKINVNNTYKYYESLQRYGRICGKMQKSGEVWWARHMYNWRVMPSRCCDVVNTWYYF